MPAQRQRRLRTMRRPLTATMALELREVLSPSAAYLRLRPSQAGLTQRSYSPRVRSARFPCAPSSNKLNTAARRPVAVNWSSPPPTQPLRSGCVGGGDDQFTATGLRAAVLSLLLDGAQGNLAERTRGEYDR